MLDHMAKAGGETGSPVEIPSPGRGCHARLVDAVESIATATAASDDPVHTQQQPPTPNTVIRHSPSPIALFGSSSIQVSPQ
jgi:hypothetical protein